MGRLHLPVFKRMYHISTRRLWRLHCRLRRHPILETGDRNGKSVHDEETQHLGRGRLYLRHGLSLLRRNLLSPHLVPGRQGRQRI